MKVTDPNLAEVIKTLNARERRAVEGAVACGRRTDEAAAVLRWVRRKLKRLARSTGPGRIRRGARKT